MVNQREQYIVKGTPSKTPKIEKGIGEFFFEQAEKHGDRIFQIDGNSGHTETYQAVRRRSTQVALYLQNLAIKPKDVVLICCQNNTDNIIPALASSYLGAYVASIDPKQAVADVARAIKQVEPRVVFVEEHSLPLIENSLKDSNLNPEIIVIGKSDKYVKMIDLEVASKEEESFKPIPQKSSDIAAILFSSGTTSAPKGIYISNNFILNSPRRLYEHHHAKPGVLFHSASLYWVTGWLFTGMVIYSGTTKVVASNATGEKLLQFVEKYKIVYVFSSNTFSYEITNIPEEVLNKYDTSSLFTFCIGGSTMDPQQLLRLRKLLPHTHVVLGYGSSEANYLAVHDLENRKAYEEKVSSSGTVLPESEFKFVDLETGQLLGPNQEGEIRTKSPYLMSGYHNYENPDCFDEDGFFKVGDIGYYDEDRYIYVTDRISEMFKYKTNQISPAILEQVLYQHPDVAEVVVFGVPHPVDRNHAAACVVLKIGSNASGQELAEFINSKVSDSNKLRAGVMIVDSIQKSPTGKYQRRVIRDYFIEAKK